jgi:hypothetical protein
VCEAAETGLLANLTFYIRINGIKAVKLLLEFRICVPEDMILLICCKH